VCMYIFVYNQIVYNHSKCFFTDFAGWPYVNGYVDGMYVCVYVCILSKQTWRHTYHRRDFMLMVCMYVCYQRQCIR
jgi:hypothetical protein